MLVDVVWNVFLKEVVFGYCFNFYGEFKFIVVDGVWVCIVLVVVEGGEIWDFISFGWLYFEFYEVLFGCFCFSCLCVV